MTNKEIYKALRKALNEMHKEEEAETLAYFKRELLKHLNTLKDEKETHTERLEKAIFALTLIKSGYPVGTVRTWRGTKFKKVAQGKWRRIYDSETRGAKMSIARLKKQVEKANSIDELFDIVMNNTHRFSDANGKPLAIVKELKAAVDEKKSRLNAGKPSTKQQIDDWKKQNNADSVNEIKDWATYKRIHGISDDREETMKWFINSELKGLSSFYNDSSRKKSLYKLLERSLEDDYRLLLGEMIKKDLSKDNFLEEIGSYIIALQKENDYTPLSDKVIKNQIKKVASIIKGIKAFKKYHGEPVQRDLSKNEVAKAKSFDELDHIFAKQGIQFDKLLKTCHFESVKKACVGIEEFMHDFPFLGRLKLKILSLHKGNNSFSMFAKQEGANLRVGFDFNSFNQDFQKDLSGKTRLLSKYHNSGDGHVSVESFGYHEMAHHLDNVIRHSYLRSTGYVVDSEDIINKAFENVKNQMKDCTRDEAIRSISGYALTNHFEAFAEAFADFYIYGEKNCNPLAREIVRIAKDMYNKIDGGRKE